MVIPIHRSSQGRRPRQQSPRATGSSQVLPQLEGAVHTAEQHWNEVGAPEAARLQRDITGTDRELTKLSRAAMNERL
ncbi:MAG: hypothetical protein ACRD0U_15895, partial [Acidimicrobiales bacterium]